MELGREKSTRAESDRNNQKLDQLLNERTNDIRRLTQELETSRLNIEKVNGEKARLFSEADKFKSHMLLLTEQNQKVLKLNISSLKNWKYLLRGMKDSFNS
jgi:hypothetical protein